MTESSFTDAGLVMARFADLLGQIHTSYEGAYGKGVNLASDSFDGHISELVADLTALVNGIVQELYDQQYLSNSSGSALDGNVSLVGVERQTASPSTIEEMQFTAAKATTVPAGTIVSSSTTNLSFATDEDLVFYAAGDKVVACTCTINGPNDVAIGEIDTLTTGVTGITAVTNLTTGIPGSNRQTDGDLKTTHALAVATSGEDDLASIYEALYSVTGVTAVYAFQNDKAYYQGLVPGHHIYIVTIGGSDIDVATAIQNNKTSTVGTYGTDESVDVYNDTICQSNTVNFDRGANVSVYIEMTIDKIDGLYPDNGDDTIKQGLADLYSLKKLNDDVIYNEIWSKIYVIPGIASVNSMYVGLSASPSGTSDITMTAKQRPNLDTVYDTNGDIASINIVINEA